MMINDITAKVGANKKIWRVGRGPGSGSGKMSGRGHKGAGARAGYGGRALQEGGGLPLFRRVPIRGFSNFRFETVYQPVNVGDLADQFPDGAEVTVEAICQAGLASTSKGPIKVLGGGALAKKLTVTADAFSDAAIQKIIEAGGQANDLSGRAAQRAKDRVRAEAAAKAAAEAAALAKAEAEAKAKAKAEAKAKAKAEGKGGKSDDKEKKAESKKEKQPKKDKSEKAGGESGKSSKG